MGFEVRCSEQKAPEVAAALHSPWLSCPLGRELLRRNVLDSDCCASAEAVTVVRETHHIIYTLHTPFIHLHCHIYTYIHPLYTTVLNTICTPTTPLNTPTYALYARPNYTITSLHDRYTTAPLPSSRNRPSLHSYRALARGPSRRLPCASRACVSRVCSWR